MIGDVKMQTIKQRTRRSLTGDRPLFLALDHHQYNNISNCWVCQSSKPEPFIRLSDALLPKDYKALEFSPVNRSSPITVKSMTNTGCQRIMKLMPCLTTLLISTNLQWTKKPTQTTTWSLQPLLPSNPQSPESLWTIFKNRIVIPLATQDCFIFSACCSPGHNNYDSQGRDQHLLAKHNQAHHSLEGAMHSPFNLGRHSALLT